MQKNSQCTPISCSLQQSALDVTHCARWNQHLFEQNIMRLVVTANADSIASSNFRFLRGTKQADKAEEMEVADEGSGRSLASYFALCAAATSLTESAMTRATREHEKFAHKDVSA